MKQLNKLKNRKFNSLLLLTFEDQQIIQEVKENLSFNKIKVISKADIIGKSIPEIIKLIKTEYYDLFIISNRNSQLNRSISSLKILGLLSKSKEQFFLFDDNTTEFFNKSSLFFNLIPKIIFGTIFGLITLIRAYFHLLFIDLVYKDIRTNKKIENKVIAYLRADLSGKIIAGGSLTHIKGFINGAKDLGFETFYIADYPILNENSNYIVKPNFLLDFFDEFQLINYHFRIIKAATKIFKDKKPSLIYQRHTVFNASGIVLSRKFNIPIILEVNSSEVWVRKNWSRLFLENIAKKFEIVALKKADVIGVVSKIVKDEIIPLGASESKIIINPNGVNTKVFSPEIDGNSIRSKYNLGASVVVGFIGTFTKWHGVEILFDAALKILKENKNIKFLFVGEGNLKVELANITHEKDLSESIIFTGLVPHAEAPNYLAACDILVSPHLGFETKTKFFGSPTKLFEYMSMGKAIIASDLEQIGEIIIDNENGLKIKPGDSEKLKEKILILATNGDLRSKLGFNARKYVEKYYTWKMNAGRVLSKL